MQSDHLLLELLEGLLAVRDIAHLLQDLLEAEGYLLDVLHAHELLRSVAE